MFISGDVAVFLRKIRINQEREENEKKNDGFFNSRDDFFGILYSDREGENIVR